MTWCIIESGAIVNVVEASAEYAASQGWIENQGWAIGWVRAGAVFVAPQASDAGLVPAEVPRWAGVLALKRHCLLGGQLLVLAADDNGSSSLYAAVLANREMMPAGEARDRLDVALDDAKDWLRMSPTVQSMCSVLSLTSNQADALFIWADAQVGTV